MFPSNAMSAVSSRLPTREFRKIMDGGVADIELDDSLTTS